MAITAIAAATPGTFAVVNKATSRGQAGQLHLPVVALGLDGGAVKNLVSAGGSMVEAEGISGFAYISGPGQLTT